MRLTALALSLMLTLTACGEDPSGKAVVGVENRLPSLSFTLSTAHGATVTEKDFEGKVALVFFGYANCPDICPTTMARLAQVTGTMGERARNVRILFISVDPHRDTPEILDQYVKAFDNEHAVGLTGTERQIQDVARAYRVSYQIERPKESTPTDNYDVTHSKGVYVFDGKGKVRLLVTDIDRPGATEELAKHLDTLVTET